MTLKKSANVQDSPNLLRVVQADGDVLVDPAVNQEHGMLISDRLGYAMPYIEQAVDYAWHLQSGHIDREALLRKYGEELHANEVMLLAYYIAAANVETAYAEIAGYYQPFEGIVLTDTFQASEAGDRREATLFPRNNERIERQLSLDIRVIIGNPPWSRQQGSQNDDNPNQRYLTLDQSIRSTYAARSAAKLKNTLYDSYVRAVRWASTRVRMADGGIVGFVTNSGFIDTKSFDGFRKSSPRISMPSKSST